MANGFNDIALEENAKFFRKHLEEQIPSRLASIYSMYRYFALEIIALVNDEAVISREDFDEYLTGTLLPYATSWYCSSTKINRTFPGFVKDVISAVGRLNLPVEEVSTWLKPNVPQRQNGSGPAIHIVRQKVMNALSEGGTPYTSGDITAITRSVSEGCNISKTTFDGSRLNTIKFPRGVVDKECLSIIDGWFEPGSDGCEGSDKQQQVDHVSRSPEDAEKEISRLLDEKERLLIQLDNLKRDHAKDIHQLHVQLEQEEKKSQKLAFELDVEWKNVADLEQEISMERKEKEESRKRKMSTAVGSSVINSLQMAINEDNCNAKQGPSASLDDSGILSEDDDDIGRKCKKSRDLSICNLCSQTKSKKKSKKSDMIKCNACDQWQHRKCANIALSAYDQHWACADCKQSH